MDLIVSWWKDSSGESVNRRQRPASEGTDHSSTINLQYFWRNRSQPYHTLAILLGAEDELKKKQWKEETAASLYNCNDKTKK